MRQPPPPGKRQQPLPEQQPNPSSDDPEALAKIKAIAESPTYRQADRDLDFLQRGDMRGVRLMLDYLKPQTLLNEHEVAHTIVVFGSTRIPEPAVATRAAADLAALTGTLTLLMRHLDPAALGPRPLAAKFT